MNALPPRMARKQPSCYLVLECHIMVDSLVSYLEILRGSVAADSRMRTTMYRGQWMKGPGPRPHPPNAANFKPTIQYNTIQYTLNPLRGPTPFS